MRWADFDEADRLIQTNALKLTASGKGGALHLGGGVEAQVRAALGNGYHIRKGILPD